MMNGGIMKVQRATQFSVYLENRVGALADLCEIVATHQINLVAICAIDTVEEAVLRIVPEDFSATEAALLARDFRPIETEVLIVEVANRPGATGQVAYALAQAGVNIVVRGLSDRCFGCLHPKPGSKRRHHAR